MHDPHPGAEKNLPLLNKDTEVPMPKPSFIYTHLKAHDLGLKDRSQGKGS